MENVNGCPGCRMSDFSKTPAQHKDESGTRGSELRQWPIQLHLISPMAPYYQKADVLIAADCVAYSVGDFHKDYLKGKSIAIACPKLDEGLDQYMQKIRALFDEANINTLTVMTMQVPCCGGLVGIVQRALEGAKRKVPVRSIVVSLQGVILSDEWLAA